jgi:hypothetical protein
MSGVNSPDSRAKKEIFAGRDEAGLWQDGLAKAQPKLSPRMTETKEAKRTKKGFLWQVRTFVFLRFLL